MGTNDLPRDLPDGVFAHLLRLAAVVHAPMTTRQVKMAVRRSDADARVAGALGVMSAEQRRDALDGAAASFLLPRYAAHAADLAAARLEREFKLGVARRRPL